MIAMRLPRFPVSSVEGEHVELDDRESRHAVKVLRVKEGDRLVVFDEAGHEAEAEVVSVRGRVQARVTARCAASRELRIAITAACAVPKGKRLEFMVQKLAELGAARFVPVVFERSVARLGTSKLKRLEQVARDAAKQCGRSTVMRIETETSLEDFLREPFDRRWVGLPEAHQGVPVIEAVKTAAFLVGPEGGFTAEEESRILESGVMAAKLAPTVLRIETAALSFMAVLAHQG